MGARTGGGEPTSSQAQTGRNSTVQRRNRVTERHITQNCPVRKDERRMSGTTRRPSAEAAPPRFSDGPRHARGTRANTRRPRPAARDRMRGTSAPPARPSPGRPRRNASSRTAIEGHASRGVPARTPNPYLNRGLPPSPASGARAPRSPAPRATATGRAGAPARRCVRCAASTVARRAWIPPAAAATATAAR